MSSRAESTAPLANDHILDGEVLDGMQSAGVSTLQTLSKRVELEDEVLDARQSTAASFLSSRRAGEPEDEVLDAKRTAGLCCTAGPMTGGSTCRVEPQDD